MNEEKFEKPTVEQTAWVVKNITTSLKGDYTYRDLVYNLMEYNSDAYMVLQLSGLLYINNLSGEIDNLKQQLKAHKDKEDKLRELIVEPCANVLGHDILKILHGSDE